MKCRCTDALNIARAWGSVQTTDLICIQSAVIVVVKVKSQREDEGRAALTLCEKLSPSVLTAKGQATGSFVTVQLTHFSFRGTRICILRGRSFI